MHMQRCTCMHAPRMQRCTCMHVPRTCHAYLHACAHMHARMQVGEYDFYGESDAWTWMYNRRTSMVVHPEEGSYDMFF